MKGQTLSRIEELMQQRILVLDGAMGTMIRTYNLTEEDFSAGPFAGWPVELAGCNDLLSITRPDVIEAIHERYVASGADIITTNSFNSNAISLADYGLEGHARSLARAAAGCARRVADRANLRNPSRPRFVAGSVGPTNKSLGIASDVDNPALRDVEFDTLVAAYCDQIGGLVEGGADLILIETCFDTLNCKAAIVAAEEAFEALGRRLPLMISASLTNSGRLLSGQTIEAFYHSVLHCRPLSIGFNCSFGARQLYPYAKELARIAGVATSLYPNAGLPNISGGYDQTPDMMADDVEPLLRDGLLNIIGGCCGTTPEHIAAIAERASHYSPRPRQEFASATPTVYCGLEPLEVAPERNFVNIGERTNVAGSAKFARLIREERYEEALGVARAQIEAGAQLIDICFDDGLIDGPRAMARFLNMAAAEPEIARVPFMIDSSSWPTIEAGLRRVQGKCVVNSISLKEGEEEFLRRANILRRYGAGAVVMLFDEEGQADTLARKVEVADRAWRLLCEIDFPAEDIIFDPNILAVATGIADHDSYGRDFIEACRHIRSTMPGVQISGGVSNLSFAFRGIGEVRAAMHSVFLYHAIEAGMSMGIVNPSTVALYDDIDPSLRSLVEDVVLNRCEGAGERLADYARLFKERQSEAPAERSAAGEEWRTRSVAERIEYAMLNGVADHVEADAAEAAEQMEPLAVIEQIFMPAMERIGELFGSGRMFLPQVVGSARVMKRGVGVLMPLLGGDGELPSVGRVLVATVKGDVHDIGKNIASVVMSCNGYQVEDLGVMVEAERIADRAAEWGADAVGLSGLITPSLEEMAAVAAEFERRGLNIPIIISGATTSALHTAVKIAPRYSAPVVYCRDVADNITTLSKLLGPSREEWIAEHRAAQAALREEWEARNERLLPLAEARERGWKKSAADVVRPSQEGIFQIEDISIGELREVIDWNFFFSSWGVAGRYPDILAHPERGEQAQRLMSDASKLLDRIERERALTPTAVVAILPAQRGGDDIVVAGRRLAQLRNQQADSQLNLSLADYIYPEGDWVGLFVVSAGVGLEALEEQFRAAGDDYNAVMAKLLADRLTEALAEVVHSRVRRTLWGYESGAELSAQQIIAGEYQGVRMAFGYPACPDHSLKGELFDLLEVESRTALRLTENYMISPGESLCGLLFADKAIEWFSVGHIDEEQLADYACRRGRSPEEMERLIPKNIFRKRE